MIKVKRSGYADASVSSYQYTIRTFISVKRV